MANVDPQIIYLTSEPHRQERLSDKVVHPFGCSQTCGLEILDSKGTAAILPEAPATSGKTVFEFRKTVRAGEDIAVAQLLVSQHLAKMTAPCML